MLYIHAHSALTFDASKDIDLKAELKAIEPKAFRRTDNFIKLALLGAAHLKQNIAPTKRCGLFITSGEGNLGVFTRVRDHRFIEHLLPKPIDFINFLSNTASFYVAQYLGIEGKNLFSSHHKHPISSLITLASLEFKANRLDEIIIGGVDEVIPPLDIMHKLLGVAPTTQLAHASTFLYCNKQKEGAIASITTHIIPMDLKALHDFLESDKAVVTSLHPLDGIETLSYSPYYFESYALYSIAAFLEAKEQKLHVIEGFDESYRVITINKVL